LTDIFDSVYYFQGIFYKLSVQTIELCYFTFILNFTIE